MQIHLYIIGVILIPLALIHIIFPTYFKWDTELKQLSLMNKQMMVIHTFFVALTVFLMGVFCLIEAESIIHTSIGKTIAMGFALFWFARLVIQFLGYSSSLWKGKTFETIVHVVFSCIWLYFTVIFFIIGFHNFL